MNKKIKIGILREGKVPHDRRVPFNPLQCSQILHEYPHIELYIQPCDYRCFSNEEYISARINVQEDLSACDILMGIKEVPKGQLIEGKQYLFFSHTIKKQPHNKDLLIEILKKHITLSDYECLTDADGNRIIGFGRYAGIVGAYNTLLGYGKKYDLFDLKPAHLCKDQNELLVELQRVRLHNTKILMTGDGRVANGAIEILGALKIRKVTPFEFLNYHFREPVYVQLHSKDYHAAKDGSAWNTEDFYAHPEKYMSTFNPYTRVCDVLVHCSYWDSAAPALFKKSDMKNPDFRISVIGDVSCDINGAIPSTIRSSSIAEPFYGYNPISALEDIPFGKQSITVMAVDNLPCELPRDASEDFGKNLMERVLPALLLEDVDGLIERSCITSNGELTSRFEYLRDYVSL